MYHPFNKDTSLIRIVSCESQLDRVVCNITPNQRKFQLASSQRGSTIRLYKLNSLFSVSTFPFSIRAVGHYSLSNLHAMLLIKRMWSDDQQVRLKVTRCGFNEIVEVSKSKVSIASFLPVSMPSEKK